VSPPPRNTVTLSRGALLSARSRKPLRRRATFDVLKAVRRLRRTGEVVRLSAADPLNLAGIILPGPRIPAIPANTVTYIDGALAPVVGAGAGATA